MLFTSKILSAYFKSSLAKQLFCKATVLAAVSVYVYYEFASFLNLISQLEVVNLKNFSNTYMYYTVQSHFT